MFCYTSDHHVLFERWCLQFVTWLILVKVNRTAKRQTMKCDRMKTRHKITVKTLAKKRFLLVFAHFLHRLDLLF